jgi:hypothetical protein
VEVEYPENAILDLTRNSYPHFYDGSEIVVAGRLVDRNMDNFKADVKGHGVSGNRCLGHAGNEESAATDTRLLGVVSSEPSHHSSTIRLSSLSVAPFPHPGLE